MQLPYFTYILSQIFWSICFLILNIILNYFVLYPLSDSYQSTDKKTINKLLFDIDILKKDISNDSKEINKLESKYLKEFELKYTQCLNKKIAEFDEIEKSIEEKYLKEEEKMNKNIKKWEKKFKQFDIDLKEIYYV